MNDPIEKKKKMGGGKKLRSRNGGLEDHGFEKDRGEI